MYFDDIWMLRIKFVFWEIFLGFYTLHIIVMVVVVIMRMCMLALQSNVLQRKRIKESVFNTFENAHSNGLMKSRLKGQT